MRCIESLKVWGSRPACCLSHCVLTLIIYLDTCPEQLQEDRAYGPIRQFMSVAVVEGHNIAVCDKRANTL